MPSKPLVFHGQLCGGRSDEIAGLITALSGTLKSFMGGIVTTRLLILDTTGLLEQTANSFPIITADTQ
jgi:hypothetical protein